jgi:hypothetical protein
MNVFMDKVIHLLDIIRCRNLYSKRRFGGWTLFLSSGKASTLLITVNRSISYLRTNGWIVKQIHECIGKKWMKGGRVHELISDFIVTAVNGFVFYSRENGVH